MVNYDFKALQLIDEKDVSQENESSLIFLNSLVPPHEFLYLLLFSLAMYFVFNWLIGNFFKKSKIKNQIVMLISFLFVLFFWWIQLLFCSNLNTSTVVINTDDLLSTNEVVLSTKKEVKLNLI